MADQIVNNVNEVDQTVPNQVQTPVLPETPSVADMDPQSAVAAQGWEVIKNHPDVQRVITGANLEDFNNTVNAAIAGDRAAQMAVADHSLSATMGTVRGPQGPTSSEPLNLKTMTVPKQNVGGLYNKYKAVYPFELQANNSNEAQQILNKVYKTTPENTDLIEALQNQFGFLKNKEVKFAKDLQSKKQAAIDYVKHKGKFEGGSIQQFAEGGAAITPQATAQPTGIPLINTQTNELEMVPHEQAAHAFTSGQYNLHANQPVVLTDPKGNLVEVEPSEVYPSISEGGYNFASPNQVHDANMQARYGEGAVNAAKAFGAAAARTATFGASDVGLTQSGLVNPETLRELKERNPGSSIAGDVTGIVGSLLAAPESGVGRLASAGKAAEGAAASLLPAGESLAARVLNTAGSKALGSAVEGLGYGAGNVVTEAALGDPNLNAQSAMAHIGLSGLLGGALGGALGAGEVVIPEAVKAASEALGKIKEGPIGDIVGKTFDKASAFLSGKPEADINLVRLNRDALLKSPVETEKAATELSKVYQDAYSHLEKVSKEVSSEIRPAEMEKLIQPVDPAGALNKFEDIHNELKGVINELRAEPEIYSPSAARQLEKYEQRFLGRPGEITDIGEDGLFNRTITKDEAYAGNAVDAFRSMDDLKQMIDQEIKYGKFSTDPVIKRTESLLRGLRSKIKDSLEDPNVWGEAGVRQAEYNDALSSYLRSKQAFEKQFGTKTITKSGSAKYKIDPIKINTYLKQLDTLRGDAKTDILKDFQDTSEKYLQQIQKSYSALPDKEFSREAVDNISEKIAKAHQEYSEQAEIQNAASRLGANASGAGLGTIVAHELGVPGALTGVYATLKSPLLTLQRLAKFERLVNKTTNAISKGASNLFKSGSSSAENIAGFIGSKAALSTEDHFKTASTINDLHSNPEKLIDKLQQSTDKLQDHANAHSTAIQTAAANALNFLKTKLPEPAPQTPLGSKIPPTKTEINNFNKYYETVQNPTGVFQQMKAGLLTKESVETLSTVYPDLYNQMKQEVMEHMVNAKAAGKPIPYQMKTQLSLFMGQDMDLSTAAKAIVSNQIAQGQAMAEKSQLDQGFMGPVKPTQGGLKKLDLSNRSMTSMQSIGSRHLK